MQQLAILHTEQISRKGEIKYFQIPLPGKTKRIIAVEASAVMLSSSSSNAAPAPMMMSMMMSASSTFADQVENIGDGGSGGGGGNTGDGSEGGGNGGTYNACPNPGRASIDSVSDSVAGGIRTQVFRIGAAVNPGFIYSCSVYSVVVSITAVDGDTPQTVATKLALAVTNTSLAT